jgi:2-polyprenyl-3-methyl-5-hydroxy-6-metoxy-1,4-benzoquinol methylase
VSSIDNYNEFYERGGWNRDSQYPSRILRNLARVHALPLEPFLTKSALDLGCGRGEFSEALAEKGFGDVLGMDVSSKAIEISERNLSRNPATRYVLADFFQYDFGSQKFNFILALGFSPFNTSDFVQIERLLRRLRELLSPGGSIAICVPNNGCSGGTSWHCWDANEVAAVQQLASRYFGCVETHQFSRIAGSRWPVFRYNKLINCILALLCRMTGRGAMLGIVLRSPREPNKNGP